MNKTPKIVPIFFKSHPPKIRWAVGHLCQCSVFLKSLAHLQGNYQQPLWNMYCMISYATSSVMATVNIRLALSDGSGCHDLLLVTCLYFFVLGHRTAGWGLVSVSGKHSVKSSLSSRDRNWSGQLPMSECPSTQEMAKRHTHSCLPALAWLTVSPPSEWCRHAFPVSVSGKRWYFTTDRWYRHAAQLISPVLLFWGGRCKRITTSLIGHVYSENQTCLCSACVVIATYDSA